VASVYAVGDVLGEGATAIVHRGELLQPREYVTSGGQRRPIPEVVAIKTIHKANEASDAPFSAEDTQREIECMRAITHPHVLQLFEVYHSEAAVTLVLQLATGGELFDAIVERGSFSEASAASAVRGLCSALSLLHAKGIVHRDLKAENVLMHRAPDAAEDAEPTVMLTDFGLARQVPTDGSLMSEACGSPAYAAPEILAGEGYSGTACDMWSVGVIVYMLLCGYPPFYADDLTELFVAIMSAKYEFGSPEWDDIEPQAKDLISGLLQTEPSDRMSAADVLEHPWITSTAKASDLSAVPAELGRADSKYNLIRKAALGVVAGGRLEKALAPLRNSEAEAAGPTGED